MAVQQYAGQLVHLPEEVTEPLADFLTSGLQQVERVFKGPRPRMEVSGIRGYRSKRTDLAAPERYGPGSEQSKQSCKISPARQVCFTTLPILDYPTRSGRPEASRRHLNPIAEVAGSGAVLFWDPEATQTPLRLLSDTVRHVFAGTAARTMSQAFIHPIDTIKTRMQVNKVTASPLLKAWRQSSKDHTLNVFIGRHRVLKLRHWLIQGPVDLYRGLTCAVLGTIPVAMLYFSTYEACKGALEARGASGTVAHLASASTGAVVSAFLRVPTDTLRHQTQAYLVPDFIQGARSIIAAQGLRGLYHGLVPTLLRDVPELTLQFTLYESLRRATQDCWKVEKLQTWQHLVLGGVSGAVAASATMPLDVAKTSLQCGPAGGGGGVGQIFSQIVKEKGAQGLFAGMGPRVTQIAIQGAVFFTLFEAWKAHLKPAPQRLGDDRLIGPKLWRKRRGHVWKRQFVFQ